MQKISLHQLLPGPGTQTCKWYKRTTGHVSYTAVRGATFVVLQLTTQACEVIAHTSFEKADLVLPSQLPPNDHTSNIVLLSIWLSAAELAHKWCMDRVEACFNSAAGKGARPSAGAVKPRRCLAPRRCDAAWRCDAATLHGRRDAATLLGAATLRRWMAARRCDAAWRCDAATLDGGATLRRCLALRRCDTGWRHDAATLRGASTLRRWMACATLVLWVAGLTLVDSWVLCSFVQF